MLLSSLLFATLSVQPSGAYAFSRPVFAAQIDVDSPGGGETGANAGTDSPASKPSKDESKDSRLDGRSCVWRPAEVSGSTLDNLGVSFVSRLADATSRDKAGVTEYLHVQQCTYFGGVVIADWDNTRWWASTPPRSDPPGDTQRLSVRRRIAWPRVVPQLNPANPRQQILFLPTWISIDNSTGQYNGFTSLPEVAPWGTVPTATATVIGMVWYPGNSDDPKLCANTTGKLWQYGDDKKLNDWEDAGSVGPNPLPQACRYRYETLGPRGSPIITANIALRYRIVYTGLTRPMSNGSCTLAGTYTCSEVYDAPATPISMRVREVVAVATSDTTNNQGSDN